MEVCIFVFVLGNINVLNGNYEDFFFLFNLVLKIIYLVYVMFFVLFVWKFDVFCIERVSECFIL